MWRPPQLKASQLRGKTIRLLGLGKIGRETARLLAPWGATLRYSARRDADLAGLPPMQRVDLDTLMRTSDVVVVLASLKPETRGIVSAEKLKLMKPTAILVNTARGAIVDEAALAEALKLRAIAGAALDCFAVEPLPATSPLRGLPNLILTPHMIGHTIEAHHSLEVATRENLDLILAGQPPRYVVNPAVLRHGPRNGARSGKTERRRRPLTGARNLTCNKRRAPVAEGPPGAGPCGLTQARRTIAGTRCLTLGAPTCCIIA